MLQGLFSCQTLIRSFFSQPHYEIDTQLRDFGPLFLVEVDIACLVPGQNVARAIRTEGRPSRESGYNSQYVQDHSGAEKVHLCVIRQFPENLRSHVPRRPASLTQIAVR